MVKTVEEIYQEMLSAYGEKTGVAPAEGCDLSARLYACPFFWRNFREYGPAHSSGDGLYDSRPDPL